MTRRKGITINLTEYEALILDQAINQFMLNIDLDNFVDEGKKYPKWELVKVHAAQRISNKVEKAS